MCLKDELILLNKTKNKYVTNTIYFNIVKKYMSIKKYIKINCKNNLIFINFFQLLRWEHLL